MAIPTQTDRDLAAIDSLHACVMTSLRVFIHTPGRDPRRVRELVQDYCDRIVELLDR